MTHPAPRSRAGVILMTTSLPERPPQYFIDELLVPQWDPSTVVGFEPTDDPTDQGFVPVGTSLDDVGESYPSLTVQRTNESSGGETGYDFMTERGPGQNRDGQLLVTARVEDNQDGYVGDSSTYGTVDAEDLASDLVDEVERICIDNATASGTELAYVGSYSGSDAPNDYDETPTVFIDQCIVLYSWSRTPS